MLKKEEYLKNITNYLISLERYVEINNSLSLSDINKLLEDFFAEILNKIYDLNLVNMNLIKYNYPAIDLGDEDSKISYQITATNDRKKIQYTLDKYNENLLYETYDELYILIVANKKNYTKNFNIGNINFDFSNIIDIEDIIKEISNIKNIKKIEEILNYIEDEMKSILMLGTNKKNNYYIDNIYKLIEPEIKDNICNILTLVNVVGSIRFNLRDVLNLISKEKFSEIKIEGGYYFNFAIIPSRFEFEKYNYYEKELLKVNDEQAKYIIELYSQFKLFKKYNDLFKMRVDEYDIFREVLLKELNKSSLKSKSII